jgi:predicted N-acetyltransferase YhbS
MAGPRAPHEVEYSDLIRFLDENLRPDQQWSIRDEYPMALSQNNLQNMRVIFDETAETKTVLSHAVIRPLLVRSPIGIFKVAAIGSVVTDTAYRNKGLSAQIIEECLSSARAQDCDFAILWTNLYDFYRKFGFELAGTEVSFRLNGTFPKENQNLKFLKTNKIDPAAVYRVFGTHSVTSVRTLDEIRRYLEIPNSRVYSAWDQQGQLQAYAIEGKGADLQGYIHEWGGAVPKVLALLDYIQGQSEKEHTVIVPGHAQNLRRQLTDLGHTSHAGFLGMIKILQPSNLFGKIIRQARTDFGINDLRLELKDGAYYIGIKDSLFKTNSEADIVRLVFGPQKPSDLHGFDPSTLSALENLLPIKMWLWGWDSI